MKDLLEAISKLSFAPGKDLLASFFVAKNFTTYRLASFGDWFGARSIDSLIILIPNSIIPIIPAWLYGALQQSGSNQATVGQKAMNIKVISLNSEPVNLGQATGRFFGNFHNVLT